MAPRVLYVRASRGMQMLIGELDAGIETLRAFHTLWVHLGFHPEGFNLVGMHVQPGQKGYPLRPEHVESLFWAHRTTGQDEWLRAGADVLRSLDRLRLPCGYAAVSDVINGTLEDKMESFFLSETLKYLYLLFDPDDDFYAHGRYVFTTEAHPLPLDLNPNSATQPTTMQPPSVHRRHHREAAAADDVAEGSSASAAWVAEMEAEAEAEEAAEVAVALAQLQGLPHPEDDSSTPGGEGGEDGEGGSGEPILVGACAMPSDKVMPHPLCRPG